MKSRPRAGWEDDAACKGMDVDLFIRSSDTVHPHPDAVAACQRCPVITDCLVDEFLAVKSPWDLHGYRGGMQAEPRRNLMRRWQREQRTKQRTAEQTR